LRNGKVLANHLLRKSQYKLRCWRRADGWYFSGSNAKIKWRLDDDELKAMGPAFEARWKEFFQDRPDKADSIYSPSLLGVCISLSFH
jgi:hypothetical protein